MTEPYCDFQVGDKVTLRFQPVEPPRDDRPTYPKFGVVYTVRDVYVSPFGNVLIRVKEIVNGRYLYAGRTEPTEGGFDASYFRRVIDTTKQVEPLKQLVIKTVREVYA